MWVPQFEMQPFWPGANVPGAPVLLTKSAVLFLFISRGARSNSGGASRERGEVLGTTESRESNDMQPRPECLRGNKEQVACQVAMPQDPGMTRET